MLKKLKDAGATLVPVSLPATPRALSAYYVIASAEASSNLARYDGVRFGELSLLLEWKRLAVAKRYSDDRTSK